MHTFTKADWNHVNGTSLKGTIRTTRRALETAFGEPIEGDGYKTTTEWLLLFDADTEKPFVGTVYDWKRYEDGAPGQDEIYDWHIGGHDDYVVRVIESLVVHVLV